MTDAANALVLEHLSHFFGAICAADDLSLAVAPGEIVCLVGPSGCGKTTVLRLVAGLEMLQSGRVHIAGRLIGDAASDRAVPPEGRSVGLVFQDFALFPHLTVEENLSFGLRRLDAAKRRQRVADALEQVGMQAHAGAYPHMLSGGQQQRVALARALAPRPKVMLLDEPFSGLDTLLRGEVRDQTLHILKESEAATLLVTHDPEEAMFMADRVAVMRAGRIEQIDRPETVYYHPRNAFVAGFFGEVNRIEGVVAQGDVKTPLGSFSGNGAADGTKVTVLIRPEAIRLLDDAPPRPDNRAATVLASRMLGRSSLIHLEMAENDGPPLHLHSRMPGRVLPAEAARVTVGIDPSQVFVFPIDNPT